MLRSHGARPPEPYSRTAAQPTQPRAGCQLAPRSRLPLSLLLPAMMLPLTLFAWLPQLRHPPGRPLPTLSMERRQRGQPYAHRRRRERRGRTCRDEGRAVQTGVGEPEEERNTGMGSPNSFMQHSSVRITPMHTLGMPTRMYTLSTARGIVPSADNQVHTADGITRL